MAQSSWPFENIDTTETQFSLWARNIGEGVIKDAGEELEPFADGTGLVVKVKPGQALVRGHFYLSTAQTNVTIPAADLTNPRIDSVVLRLDPVANNILLAVAQGTAAAEPVAPTLTKTTAGIYELLIANVEVSPASAVIDAGDVSDERFIFERFDASILEAIEDLQTDVGQLQTDVALKQPLTPDVNAKTANYTLALADRGGVITANGTFTITVPGGVFAAGDRVDIVNIGTGVVDFDISGGLSLFARDDADAITAQYAAATVLFGSSTVAYLIGAIEEA